MRLNFEIFKILLRYTISNRNKKLAIFLASFCYAPSPSIIILSATSAINSPFVGLSFDV